MVFDQSVFVKLAIANVSREAVIGLVLTGVMILVFLGSPRATIAVLLAVPLSMLVCLLIINFMGGSINTMILGGLALVFSRLIDNGVIVLENIFRHMEMGKSPLRCRRRRAAPKFRWPCWPPPSPPPSSSFPVTSFSGVSKYIFTPLALGVVLLHLRLLLLRHDRGAALLRQVHLAWTRMARTSTSRRRRSKPFFARFDRAFNEQFQAHAGLV